MIDLSLLEKEEAMRDPLEQQIDALDTWFRSLFHEVPENDEIATPSPDPVEDVILVVEDEAWHVDGARNEPVARVHDRGMMRNWWSNMWGA